jgi:copper resistance protein D
MHSLVDTGYGRLLLLKVVLYAAMVGLAGTNRQYLLPHLLGSTGTGQASDALRKLVRSASIEIVLGIAIVCLVGLLGIMPPGE